MTHLLIKSAKLSHGQIVDILVRDGKIVEIGQELSSPGAQIIDAEGLYALSGFVDLHTHLREPGGEGQETVLTGSQAAAAGGFTTVFAMANTKPVADSAGVVEQVQSLGIQAGYTRVQPIGAVTKGLEGNQLAELSAMANSRANVRVFSDDGHCVSDSLLMRRALEYVQTFDGVIAQHAQDPRLTEGAQMNESALSASLGLPGWPSVAEESIIARDVLLAKHVGGNLHVCHVSTAGSVEVIRWAKEQGIQVTAEVTPHHLILTEELVSTYDARYKVNPPLRKKEDVLALRQALADGIIDVIGTDHAPHTEETKSCEWQYAAMGMVGLETAFSVVNTSMQEYDFSYEDIERVMSLTPAKIGRLPIAGQPIAEGSVADIVLLDPEEEYSVSVDVLRGKSVNSPFLGTQLKGRVKHTIFQGYLTYENSELIDSAVIAEHAANKTFGERSNNNG